MEAGEETMSLCDVYLVNVKRNRNRPKTNQGGFFMNRHSLCSIANAQMISLIVIVYSLITNDCTLRLGTTYCYFFVNTTS